MTSTVTKPVHVGDMVEVVGHRVGEARRQGTIVEILGELSGTDRAPRFEGVAQVREGSLRLPGLPLPVTGISGVVDFVPEAVRLAGVRFAFGNGTGVCDGHAHWQSTTL